jgi:mannose-6-phosphate isomerase-like protein (cupin superfamily)
MPEPVHKKFEAPDETRTFANGQLEVVHVGTRTAARGTLQPGWRWSESVKPIVGTDSCQVHHFGYALSGTMMVRMDDGTEAEINPGDVYEVPPGHDAWVLGNDPVVSLEFESKTAEEFAKG